MSTAQERIEIFQDTLEWIRTNEALSASIPIAKKKTTLFYEDDYPDFGVPKIKDTIVEVMQELDLKINILDILRNHSMSQLVQILYVLIE